MGLLDGSRESQVEVFIAIKSMSFNYFQGACNQCLRLMRALLPKLPWSLPVQVSETVWHEV